jgi:hypothetical protein
MSIGSSETHDILPFPLPEGRAERAALVILRRMAAHGFRDAAATMLALDTFGTGFRRVLVLLRAYMVELARNSNRTISLAPWCAMRMTEDEGLLMEALAQAGDDHVAAARSLRLLSRNSQVGEPLSVACMVNRALRGM